MQKERKCFWGGLVMDRYNDEYGAEYQVSFKAIIEEFHLEVIHMPEGKHVKITRTDVNRPGLALAGFLSASTIIGFS